MDIKSKSRHKLAVFVIIITVLAPAVFVLARYQDYYYETKEMTERFREEYVYSEDFLRPVFECGYYLYDEEIHGRRAELGEEYADYSYDYMWAEAGGLYPYLNCSVKDLKGKSVGSADLPDTEDFSGYKLVMEIAYDENGSASVRRVTGENSAKIELEMKKILSSSLVNGLDADYGEMYDLTPPKDRVYTYALTEENLDSYLDDVAFDMYEWSRYELPDGVVLEWALALLLVAAAACLYPQLPLWSTGNEKIFRAPAEIVVIAASCGAALFSEYMPKLFIHSGGSAGMPDALCWIASTAGVYWVAGCVQYACRQGLLPYLRECSLLYQMRFGIEKTAEAAGKTVHRCREKVQKMLDSIDLEDKSSRSLLFILLVNLVCMGACGLFFCLGIPFGILAVLGYTYLIYLVVGEYLKRIRKAYAGLHGAVSRMADGQLDVEIDGDLSVFRSMREELLRIQNGYQVAVEREVKSQRMKTELITNVSHDLKTPLTAIITYVNLLKEEKDEEKRKEYVEVLEKKSMRLKVLIEDLFEASKASSGDVKLDLMEVDVVNLFKQVLTELAEKFERAQLEIRSTYPEERVTAELDSQKTYRIFENLLVNVVKYALANTRVYVKIVKEETEVTVSIMNISAEELNFSPEEITERFVRGDQSRNTEGSGLGLAIVKSFTELQGGRFVIETEGDLFKAAVIFPVLH